MLIEGLTEIISQDLHVKNSVKSDRIHALDSDVINRIAAGEVVQRPSSALKELMENALDAGASQITIILKSGGMKMLSVQDNGRGIHKEDLPLLCKRFTTSKISSYEDLRKIQTFGFRGEALCSISLVSRLSVLTKRKSSNDECAFKAQYLNEEMISCQPVAGLDGTLITVEDMFYNTPLRLASLKNHNEEHQNCIKVVSKYAIHNAGRAAFVLKKHGQTRADVHTSIKSQIFGGSNADAIRKNEILAQKDAIRTIFGNAVTQELIEVDWKGPDAFGNPVIQGFVSTTNYHSKSSGQFILFINHRLVKCDSLKKSIETFYQEILPKNCSPFVYLSLQVKSESVDVNVHPTKSKVHFLYEKEISDLLRAHLQEALKVSNVSRAFYTQIQAPISNGSDFSCITNTTKEGVLTSKANTNAFVSTSKEGAPASKARVQNKNESDSKSIKISASESKKSAGIEDVVRSHPERKTNPQNLVRTKSSQHNGALYAYLQHPERNIFMASSQKSKPKPFKIPESIEFLTREIEKSSSDNLEKIFENLVYVGCVDYDSVLIQCTTKLYLLKFQYCR
jgi:DNA mismatch repair protein MLH1